VVLARLGGKKDRSAAVHQVQRGMKESIAMETGSALPPHNAVLARRLVDDALDSVEWAGHYLTDEGSARHGREQDVALLCLHAALSLLGITKSLIQSGPGGHEAATQPELAARAKLAGRGAYHAALALATGTDPRPQQSAAVQALAAATASSATTPGADAAGDATELSKRARQALFFQHWERIKADGATASQFIEFLHPLADLDGVSVSYDLRVDAAPDGTQPATRGKAPVAAEPGEGGLRRKALSFALNEQGRISIESDFMDPQAIRPPEGKVE